MSDQFWIAMEVEACYQLYFNSIGRLGIWLVRHAHLAAAWPGNRWSEHKWFFGTETSRRRFWARWTRERMELRAGRRVVSRIAKKKRAHGVWW